MKSTSLPETVSQQQLAEILGLTVQRVGQLAVEGIVSKTGKNEFDFLASVQGYLNFTANRKSNQWDAGANGGEGGEYDEHRARLTKAKADIAEIQAETMKGNFHEAGAVEAVWTDMLNFCRSRLLAIPTRTAPLFMDETKLPVIQDILQGVVYEALNDLANYDPEPVLQEYAGKQSSDIETSEEK